MTYSMLRSGLAAATTLLAVATVSCPAAGAITPPELDAGAAPPSGEPGPVQPMAQRSPCVATGVLPGSDPGAPNSNSSMLNLSGAWEYSRGDGQLVAVLDTGIDFNHPDLAAHQAGPGFDVIAGQAGVEVTEYDEHGTQVAGAVVAGAGGRVGLLPIRILDRQPVLGGAEATVGTSDALIAGLEVAVDPDADGLHAGEHPPQRDLDRVVQLGQGAVVQRLLHKLLVELIREDVKRTVARADSSPAQTEALVHFIAGALVGVLASVWPAWRASRMNVLDAISSE